MRISIDKIIEIFCKIDDFCKIFIPIWNKYLIVDKKKTRNRRSSMSESELMLTLILFQFSHYRCFKHFYLSEIQNDRYQLFTKTLSYQRFNELSEKMMMPLQVFFNTIKSSSKGVAFIDSTPIKVCDNKRIYQHQTFKNNAQRGKTTMGWFYGFKLHLIINHNAEIVNFNITTGSVSDSKVVEKLSNKITGKLYGDKGYLSKKKYYRKCL